MATRRRSRSPAGLPPTRVYRQFIAELINGAIECDRLDDVRDDSGAKPRLISFEFDDRKGGVDRKR